MDVAAALQSVLEQCLLHLLRHFRQQTRLRDLCLAGGVALNCTANGVIRRSRLFRRVFVQPAAGDDGSALGAALWVQRQRDPEWLPRRMALPLWGPCYDSDAIRRALQTRPECQAVQYASSDALVSAVARRLASGEVVGWFNGRMEFGPRALGSRSILADPRDPGMRDRLNRLVKNREDFRPFAPAVTAESAGEYFDIDPDDEWTYAHMLFVAQVRPKYRDVLPSITHVDGSARVQTVFAGESPGLWKLLRAFEAISGIPILVNTSFNVRGQPIVCTPEEALATFVSTGIDRLVMEDFVVSRIPTAEDDQAQ
jgi:carbamoyltransferase